MEDIEKNKVYFGLDVADANEHKKEIFEMIESLIKSEMASDKFNDLRLKEKKMVSLLKNNLKEIYKEMNNFSEKIPHKMRHHENVINPLEKLEKKEKKKFAKNISKAKRYSEELKEIREKIAKISS